MRVRQPNVGHSPRRPPVRLRANTIALDGIDMRERATGIPSPTGRRTGTLASVRNPTVMPVGITAKLRPRPDGCVPRYVRAVRLSPVAGQMCLPRPLSTSCRYTIPKTCSVATVPPAYVALLSRVLFAERPHTELLTAVEPATKTASTVIEHSEAALLSEP